MIFGHDRFTHVQAVVVKLDNLLTIHANEMTVSRMVGKIGIVHRGRLTQTDLAEESCPDEKGESAINGGPGNFAIFATGFGEKGFSGEVFPIGEGDLCNGFALGRQPQAWGAHGFNGAGLGGVGRGKGRITHGWGRARQWGGARAEL